MYDFLQSYDEFMELAQNGQLVNTTTLVKDLKADSTDFASPFPDDLLVFPFGKAVGKSKGSSVLISGKIEM